MLIKEAKEKIIQFSPQFALKSITPLESGTDNNAYLVNDEWIFRFPMDNPISKKSFRPEIELLPRLKHILPIQVPEFEYIAKDNNNIIYVGYKMLPGIPLLKNVFDNLGIEKQEQVFKDLAAFMQALHHFPVEVAKNGGVQAELYKGAYHPKQKNLLMQCNHLLSQEEILKIQGIISDYEKHFRDTLEVSFLLHADLKPEHILYDSTDGRVTGIIDWGDICVGDPDYDFVCLYLFYDKDFVIKLLNYFPNVNNELILAKVQFFITIRWLQDIVLGIKCKDGKFVNFCLIKLREHLQESEIGLR